MTAVRLRWLLVRGLVMPRLVLAVAPALGSHRRLERQMGEVGRKRELRRVEPAINFHEGLLCLPVPAWMRGRDAKGHITGSRLRLRVSWSTSGLTRTSETGEESTRQRVRPVRSGSRPHMRACGPAGFRAKCRSRGRTPEAGACARHRGLPAAVAARGRGTRSMVS